MQGETTSADRLHEIHEQLQEGVRALTTSEDWRRALAFAARFHSYSFGNCLLIACQRPDATYVAGFHKWLELYQEKGLSRGQYLGTLYDIGFDLPEAHVIRKEKKMYYAFFAGNWKGTLELRGLDARAYHVVDYVEGKDFGIVQGPFARLSADFSKHLLLEATPQ